MLDEMLKSGGRSNQRTWESSPIRELKNDARAATTPCRAAAGRHQHLPTTHGAARSPASGGGAGSLEGPWRAQTASIKQGRWRPRAREEPARRRNRGKAGAFREEEEEGARRCRGGCARGALSDGIH